MIRSLISVWTILLLAVPLLAVSMLTGQLSPQGIGGSAAFAQSASDLTAEDRDEIRRIITAQIAAFEADDAEAAFGYAAPRIAAKFGTPEHFLRMVRQHYEPVFRPREVAFRYIDERGHLPTQIVLIVDQQGTAHIALYPMEPQDDGTWRIAGCLLRPAPDDAAT